MNKIILEHLKKGNCFPVLHKKRGAVQGIATLLMNVHILNFFKGTIYTGNIKRVCVPGLNCYSCPGATGACPIGSFQAVVGSSKFDFSYYITGMLTLFGVLMGRLICGFLCPFGWFQDLLHKIPSKKFSVRKLRYLKYLKYVILFATVWFLGVIIVNNTGGSSPYFCKYICPQGVLEGGVPLSISNTSIRATLGNLFVWKLFILLVVIVTSIFVYRPFCKYICPLGAFYSLFNKVSFYKYYVNKTLCIDCGKCKRTCGMDVDISKSQNALECIRCGKCIGVCPTGAISASLSILSECKRRSTIKSHQ